MGSSTISGLLAVIGFLLLVGSLPLAGAAMLGGAGVIWFKKPTDETLWAWIFVLAIIGILLSMGGATQFDPLPMPLD